MSLNVTGHGTLSRDVLFYNFCETVYSPLCDKAEVVYHFDDCKACEGVVPKLRLLIQANAEENHL